MTRLEQWADKGVVSRLRRRRPHVVLLSQIWCWYDGWDSSTHEIGPVVSDQSAIQLLCRCEVSCGSMTLTLSSRYAAWHQENPHPRKWQKLRFLAGQWKNQDQRHVSLGWEGRPPDFRILQSRANFTFSKPWCQISSSFRLKMCHCSCHFHCQKRLSWMRTSSWDRGSTLVSISAPPWVGVGWPRRANWFACSRWYPARRFNGFRTASSMNESYF